MYPEQEKTVGARLGKISHLEGETDTLGKSVEELNAQVEQLHSRLSSVLRDQPEVAGNVGVPEESLVPAASKIRSIRYGVNGANQTLKSILSRLEI